MNAGVEIILERIKTHPEEFCTKGGGFIGNGKWSRILESYEQHLSPEDVKAIDDAIDKAQQDNFTEEVMTILMDGRDKALDEDAIPTPPRQRVRLSAPDGSIGRVVMDKSKEWHDLMSKGWIDNRRMGASTRWASPAITIPPTK